MILIRKESYGTILEEGKAYFVELEEETSSWTGDTEINCYVYLFDDESNGYRYETLYYSSYNKMKEFWYGI
jgi:predicted RNA-binding protein with TRAM domain